MRKSGIIWSLVLVLLLGSTALAAKKVKTGVVEGNTYTDSRYGFTITKNDNWKFKVEKEKPDEPKRVRVKLQKANYQLPMERKFDPSSWTVAYGGFWIDTTSRTTKEFAAMITDIDYKDKQKKELIKFADLINEGELGTEGKIEFGNLGPGFRLVYKQEYVAEITNLKRETDLVNDYLMGEVYGAVHAGHIYLLFFNAERADYRLCKREIETMLASVYFPAMDKKKKTATPADSAKPAAEGQ